MVVPMARILCILLILGISTLAAPPSDDSAAVPVPVAPGADYLPAEIESAPVPDESPFPERSTPASESAGEDDRSAAPTTFVAIELTAEGVVATDSLGDDWMYDFNRERFIPARRFPRDDRRGEEVARPVEERALTKLEVKPLSSTVNVGYDEYVEGDIRATGRVVVRGWVRGNIQSFDEVLVLPTGQVDGNVRAPEIEVKEGAVVLGVKTISPISPDYLTDTISIDSGLLLLVTLIILLMVAFIMHHLARKQLGRIESCITRHRAKSLAMGSLMLLLLLPVAIVLIITIIGSIVAIPLLLVAFPLAIGIGIVLFGRRLAIGTVYRFLRKKPAAMLLYITGILIFGIFWFATIELASAGGTATDILAGLGFLIVLPTTLYAACSGLGAVFLTRFGYRDYVSFRDRQTPEGSDAPAPAPPPMPKAPPVVRPPSDTNRSTRSGPSPLSSGNE